MEGYTSAYSGVGRRRIFPDYLARYARINQITTSLLPIGFIIFAFDCRSFALRNSSVCWCGSPELERGNDDRHIVKAPARSLIFPPHASPYTAAELARLHRFYFFEPLQLQDCF